jgi:formimidoylglutamate deiminase
VSRYLAPSALLPQGWARDVLIDVDAAGDITAVVPDSPHGGDSHLPGPVVPGMPNVHSHGFQRALAGRAERGGSADGDFWAWRETMYRLVERLDPETIEIVTTWVYMEMLKAGYTSVGEFHYLHHAPDGSRYATNTETSERIIASAQASGIGLTLLPVLYTYGGFGAQPPSPRQRAFTMDADEFCTLWDALDARIGADPHMRLGVAPHSLRAVTSEQLQQVLAHVAARAKDAPVHIHVAEQEAEVEACVAWSGERPVAWLLANAPVSPAWCLVHATHLDDAEAQGAAASGAVAGVCPTTEANLGDGVFAARRWLGANGRLGIGSDSNVTLDPAEELRWLEYVQRLERRERVILYDGANPSVGGRLFRSAVEGGAQALGRRVGRIAPGYRADLVVLDRGDSALHDAEGDDLLDRLVFGGARAPVRDVMVGGHWAVVGGRCTHEPSYRSRYEEAVKRLFAGR